MRRSHLLRVSGPYRVVSYSQNGDGQVFAVVHPAYPKYGSDWAEQRAHGHGGGPGIFSSMAFARELQEFLNAPYVQATVKEWTEQQRGIETRPPWKPYFRHAFKRNETLTAMTLNATPCDGCGNRLREHMFGTCPHERL